MDRLFRTFRYDEPLVVTDRAYQYRDYRHHTEVFQKIPGSLIAIILMTVVVYVMRYHLGITGIETIGDRFTINASLPGPETINFNMETINLLLPSAFTIAMLGAIESLLSATVADGVTGDKHNSNTELIAQGPPISSYLFSAVFPLPVRLPVP